MFFQWGWIIVMAVLALTRFAGACEKAIVNGAPQPPTDFHARLLFEYKKNHCPVGSPQYHHQVEKIAEQMAVRSVHSRLREEWMEWETTASNSRYQKRVHDYTLPSFEEVQAEVLITLKLVLIRHEVSLADLSRLVEISNQYLTSGNREDKSDFDRWVKNRGVIYDYSAASCDPP